VWEHCGFSYQEAAAVGLNPQMFNSFLDGTKLAIEMAKPLPADLCGRSFC
jgi:predicted homoserine dehydrogenase-like protein